MRLRVTRRAAHDAKVHNSAPKAKAEIRRWLVEQLGGSPRILDCFAGPGGMWRLAYGETDRYLGLDRETAADDPRRLIRCDSRRYLRHRAADLSAFDIFDLDAYSSPYEHLALICSRIRPTRRVGFVLTDGLGFNAAMNSLDGALLAYVGLERHRGTRT